MNTSPDTLTQALEGAATCTGQERTLRAVPGAGYAYKSERLVNYIERLETLAEEKAALGNDITEVYAEAKLEWFDPKVLRMLLKLRAMDDREEFIETLNGYMHQVGMYQQLSLDFDQREVA